MMTRYLSQDDTDIAWLPNDISVLLQALEDNEILKAGAGCARAPSRRCLRSQ